MCQDDHVHLVESLWSKARAGGRAHPEDVLVVDLEHKLPVDVIRQFSILMTQSLHLWYSICCMKMAMIDTEMVVAGDSPT